MKLCWDNINKLVMMPPLKGKTEYRLAYYEDTEEQLGYKGNFDFSEKPCINCGNQFMIKINSKPKFCDDECKLEYRKKAKRNKIDKRLKENGGGEHLIGNKNGGWNKGLRLPKDTCSFNTYNNKINWFTDTRIDPKDKRILQTKCCICKGWFRPSAERIRKIVKYVNGSHSKGYWGLYCSKHCESKCSHFGKSAEQIMKDDYLNSGKAKYSEIHNIPNKVLYYDWQQELKKLQSPLQEKTKKYEKRKLRRRKKRQSELERMTKKRKYKKERQIYLKSEEYKKEQRLKRILYLSRQRAKQKNWKHDIDYEWLVNNTPNKCPKCGIKFSYDIEQKMAPFAPSIDRIHTDKGYTKDNCVIVSWIYNCGKNRYNDRVLYIICKGFLETFNHDTP